jgi:hypothetical protein
MCKLQDWQTLISALIAILGSFFVILFMGFQIRIQKKELNYLIDKDKRNADKRAKASKAIVHSSAMNLSSALDRIIALITSFEYKIAYEVVSDGFFKNYLREILDRVDTVDDASLDKFVDFIYRKDRLEISLIYANNDRPDQVRFVDIIVDAIECKDTIEVFVYSLRGNFTKYYENHHSEEYRKQIYLDRMVFNLSEVDVEQVMAEISFRSKGG